MEDDTLTRNKAVTRLVYEGIWRDHRVDLIDELFAPAAVLHVNGIDRVGREWMYTIMRDVWLASFPDLFVVLEDQVAEGDRVCDRVTFTGTHSGAPFNGIEPSGATFSFTQMTITRLEDGAVAEVWEDFDWAGLLCQLGVTFELPS